MPKVSEKPKPKPQPAPKKELEWESGHISARCRGHRSVYIPALVCGPLAVHAGLVDENLWAVSHRAIGYNFIELPDADEVMEVAAFLLTDPRFEEALQQKTWPNFFKELPSWVRFWREEMARQNKLVPRDQWDKDGEMQAPVKDNPFLDRWLTLCERHERSSEAASTLLVKISGGYECYGLNAREVSKALKLPLLTRADLDMARIEEKDLKKFQGILQAAGIKTTVMAFNEP